MQVVFALTLPSQEQSSPFGIRFFRHAAGCRMQSGVREGNEYYLHQFGVIRKALLLPQAPEHWPGSASVRPVSARIGGLVDWWIGRSVGLSLSFVKNPEHGWRIYRSPHNTLNLSPCLV